MDPVDWIRQRLPLNPAAPALHAALSDPEYLRLYQQYITSLESLVREAEVAMSLMSKKDLPGPRRQIDFGRLNMLRRFYERDAFRYFTYRPHIRGPLPPASGRTRARDHARDAVGALWLGEEKRAASDLNDVQREIEALCADVWNRYELSPRPPSVGIIRELITALSLAQSVGLESPVTEQMQEAMSTLGDSGQYF